jgi:hypothetical protein
VSESAALAERTEGMQSPIYGDIVPIAAIQQNIARIQAAKKSVMKDGLHYGRIPGTQKDTLFKPGAELINLMFGVSVDPDALGIREDEGVDDVGLPYYRAHIRIVLKTRSGTFLGASFGSASSLEDKYKWRKATGPKEFAATAEGRRRIKFRKGDNGEYEESQVRTEVEDIRNTVLQIAMKRAEISATRRTHALSDMFGQDLEDMPIELRDSIVDGEVVARDPIKPGQRKSEQANGSNGHGTGAPTGTGPAATSTPSAGKPNVGLIVRIESRTKGDKTATTVVLDTDFKAVTYKADLAEKAEALKREGRRVEIDFGAPSDPKYSPWLNGLKVVE